MMRKLNSLLLASLFLAACQKPLPPPEPVRPVKTLIIEAQQGQTSLTLAGEVRARFETALAFRVGGKVVERHVNLGETVKRGQILAKLEPTDLQLNSQSNAAAVAGARVELQLAEAELTRYRVLREKNFISSAVLDQKQAAMEGASARLAAAESAHSGANRQVGYTTLTANADGVVTWLDLNIGQVVTTGQSLLKIAHSDSREIEVHVAEADLSRFKSAYAYRISLNAMPATHFNGNLRELAGAADPVTRSFAARISIGQPAEALGLGMSATVSDLQNAASVIRLPLVAVFSRDGKPMAWKIDQASSTVHAISLTTGAIDDNDVIIEHGLQAGDKIVTAGANLLREGQKIRSSP